jgi:hypothetical protein
LKPIRADERQMKIEQLTCDPRTGWKTCRSTLGGLAPQFVLAFGGRHLLEDATYFRQLRARYPEARLIVSSTAGEITDTEITEDQLTVTAVALEKTRVTCAALPIHRSQDSHALGRELALMLTDPELVHIFIVADGQLTNGTELARGLAENLPAGVALSGGLAGDGARFQKTVVGLDEPPTSGRIVALGFYGRNFKSSCGSAGGWAPFGPERLVTRAEGNRLFELDGRSALGLYKQYLGDQAAELPGSALRFPLSVSPVDGSANVVRTILSIDEGAQSMTFAGDIPSGARVQFMRASYEDLLDGAAQASEKAHLTAAELVVCVSCVGRRIVLGQRTEEETEIVREVMGRDAVLTGFYSYGELAPASHGDICQLHNQTMTVTAFSEV